MSQNLFWFLYQQTGGEEDWRLELADKRSEIVAQRKPAFVTVLDLSSVPQDHDWSKVKYRGPLYFDFDADGDIELACQQFKVFLAKLDDEYGFDLNQATYYASGGKGFHIEVPQECFIPKVSTSGYAWLPYIYKAMAESMVVDTLDMRVYTGKRGRMWRTPGVKRENGNYKVPLSIVEALEVTPESYYELISEPRDVVGVSPPSFNSKLGMLFNNSRDKVVDHMRGAKKRREKASTFLEPWKKISKTPPSIDMLMRGENIASGAGFQHLSMQLAIYATSVGMELDEYLKRCKGLCENHVSDSKRYNTFAKRQEELARMYRYMDSDSFYEFDVAPLIKLITPGTPVADLGVMEQEDTEDGPPVSTGPVEGDAEDGDPVTSVATPVGDEMKGVRRGFFMNKNGMWRKVGDVYEPMCRASVRNVESMYDVEKLEFNGYEFDLIAPNRKLKREMLDHKEFTSSMGLRKFFAAKQLTFQGGDAEAMALMDIMAEKSNRSGITYTFPREGFFVIDSPVTERKTPVLVYLTQSHYMTSVPQGHPEYFKLRYKPTQALSSYNIDIHNAPPLGEEHGDAIGDLFLFSREDVVADLVGWFVAAHYRSLYLYLFQQFPSLQAWGEAGAGKSQTIMMLAHLHWYATEISVKSASSCTPFAMDSHASSSTSAPLILDEYKPREMLKTKGRLEKFKDVIKAAYIGADIGERGTINKGTESSLAVVKTKATAPIVFMGEAIEMETAIIERCVTVNLTKHLQTRARTAAFNRLSAHPEVLASIGRSLIELGLTINLESMRKDVRAIIAELEARLPSTDDADLKRPAPRMVFNRAVIIHGLRTLKSVLHEVYGDRFDSTVQGLIECSRVDPSEQSQLAQSVGMSEASKVMSRLALMSRDIDRPWELRKNKDYIIDDEWIEIKLERAYDAYRTFCVSIHDTPLYDTMDAFMLAMNAYYPVVDRVCANSVLRDQGSNERIARFDLRRLRREGVKSFHV